MNALGFRHDLDHRLRSRKAIDLKETCQVIDDYLGTRQTNICVIYAQLLLFPPLMTSIYL